MDTSVRFIIGLALLFSAQLVLGSLVVHCVRRRNRVEPVWSLATSLLWYFLLMLLVTGIGILPVVGPYVALVVFLIGLKRMTGLQVMTTFMLAFTLGLMLFIISAGISALLGVDVLSIGR